MCISLSSTTEHWFVFDQYQFPGFNTPLFTLISSSINQTTQDEHLNISFSLSTYDRTILVDITKRNSNGTIQQQEQLIKLNIERADLLYNSVNHMIFIAIRNQNKLETYVNCKLIDSYFFYSTNLIDENENNNNNSFYKIDKINDKIEHYQITPTSEQTQHEIFDAFSCKQTDITIPSEVNSSSKIGRPLIRKMQHVIEKVQRRKLRARRQNNQQTSLTLSSDSLTIIYKPNIDKINVNKTSFYTILNIPQLKFHIQYYPKEHLFNIRFNNENRTQFVLFADKSADRIFSSNASLIIFLHITSTMITCYVNCELTDQELIIDSFYVQNIIRQIMDNNQHEYNRQSTLILYNKSIDQIAANFFCLKLDKKNEELLPDKYALRKFANALDILVNSLDTSNNNEKTTLTIPPTSATTTTTQSVSAVNIPLINGFGSLKAPPINPNMDTTTIFNEIIMYDKLCSTDDDCDTTRTSMKCQSGHCICPKRLFYSNNLHRCITCHDLLIGNRCFRLSNHKSTWFEANDYCQDDNTIDEGQEYTMKLASNLNRTDIQYLKESFLLETDHEQLDYIYWIGATSNFDTRKLHQINYRNKRQIPTTIFRWYDNGETAQLNLHDIWCSQTDYSSLTTINNNELCVSITSCGLYTDDCQRNYRFLCEAV
ncbi:unnamed protein product [Adineta steineri]|uniref:C-type lectin domain-containing protein n=1 Tax=Adineta steineri TaxID=433720 RepID=A0A813QNN3_9BILA|nr:unnamed protein product [Adineta steineri]CAF3538763.1 unnamed protein product [Adineta steineri]